MPSLTDVQLYVPQAPIFYNSLQIAKQGQTEFGSWTAQDHVASYQKMRAVAQTWKAEKRTEQYLIYGKISTSQPFNWEIIPYQKCSNMFSRIVQQLVVLWRVVFGGISLSETQKLGLEKDLNKFNTVPSEESGKPSELGSDAFCKAETLQKQCVLTGNKVDVLFNYAPIGLGGERLHFLIVPKEHHKEFTDLSEDEYAETMELTSKLVWHFTGNRDSIKNVYLLNKTGKDAGQTVDHWHLHVIFSATTTQDIWGKLTVFKNILFGSSPMNGDALKARVSELKKELENLNKEVVINN